MTREEALAEINFWKCCGDCIHSKENPLSDLCQKCIRGEDAFTPSEEAIKLTMEN